jgi:Fe/S biogenesis protein NfuA
MARRLPDAARGDTMNDEPVLTVTEKARRHVLQIRSEEDGGEDLALWLEVTGVAGADYAYDLYFQPVDEAGPGDVVQRHDDLPVVMAADSVDRLRGATLDMSRDLLNPGLVLQNPNRPEPPPTARRSPAMAPRPAGDLSGDVAQRVLQVLDQQVNPAIAAHGGQAELVAVEDDVAYLRLSGGCVGCGMATVTLSQGIEVAIREGVPEISQVVDVTDHASGTNPYYESAKK